MNNGKTHRIALFGIMGALLAVVLTLETAIGQFFITPPAVLSLSVLFVLCFSYDFKVGLISGILFGVLSLIVAFIVGNPLFIFPWISVLPRVFVGITAYGVYYLFNFILRNCKNKFIKESLPYSMGALIGVLTNTLLVLLALTFFAPSEYGNTFVGWVEAIITLNFPIELVASFVLTPLLSIPVKKFVKTGVR